MASSADAWPQQSDAGAWPDVAEEPTSDPVPADDEVSVVYVDYEEETGRKNFMGSCVIMLFGCLLFPAALLFLGWNENNTKCQRHIAMKADQDTEIGDCTTSAAVEGKFAFFSCPLDLKRSEDMTPLTTFNLPGLQELISMNTIAGAQKVEMYQCIESKDNVEAANPTYVTETEAQGSISGDTNYPQNYVSVAAHPSTVQTTPAPLQTSPANQTEQLVAEVQRRVRLAIDAKGRHRVARHLAEQKRQQSGDTIIATDSLLQDDVAQGGKDVAVTTADRSVIRAEHDRREVDRTAGEVYVYRMDWSHVYYDSRLFKASPEKIAQSGCTDFVRNGSVNHNPAPPDRGDGHPVELGRQKIVESNVVAGPYTLSDVTELKKFSADTRMDLSKYADKFSLSASTDNIITAISPSTLAVHPGKPYYLGSCRTERLGCIRISYNQSSAKHMSVMGEVGSSGEVTPLNIEKEWGCDASTFIRMYPEELTKDAMLDKLRPHHEKMSWVFRAVGLIAAWLALYCCFDPIAHTADMMSGVLAYVPVVGEMLTSGLEGVATMFLCVISCSFGLSCGLLVVAFVWLGCQPLISVPVLLVAVILFIGGFVATKKSDRDPKRMRKQAKQLPFQPYT